MQKIIFFGGKGGVGKTTCSASYGIHCARQGRKTLIISTDPAHSLSDIFGVNIGAEITTILPNLDCLEISPEKESKKYIEKIKSNMKEIISPVIISEINKQLDAAQVSPGSEEAAIFDKLVEIIIEYINNYDQIIFDTAPTGHTLRLLSLPELLGAWLERLIKKRRSALQLMGMANLDEREREKKLNNDPIIKILRERKEKLEKARKVLIDNREACFNFVLNAEKLPVEETKKAVAILEKYRIPIGGIVVNRILPEDIQDEFWQKRKKLEEKYLQEIKQTFKKYQTVYIPMLPTDVTKDSLQEVSLAWKVE